MKLEYQFPIFYIRISCRGHVYFYIGVKYLLITTDLLTLTLGFTDSYIGFFISYVGLIISYMLNREYRVVRNRYSRLLFTSEDRLCTNICVQEQPTNMTSQCQCSWMLLKHYLTGFNGVSAPKSELRKVTSHDLNFWWHECMRCSALS